MQEAQQARINFSLWVKNPYNHADVAVIALLLVASAFRIYLTTVSAIEPGANATHPGPIDAIDFVNREAGGGWSSEDGDAEVTPDTSPTVTRRGSFAELMPLAAWTPPPGCEDPEYEKAAREQNEADAWTVLAKARWAATQAGLDDPVAKDLEPAASLFLSQVTQAPLSALARRPFR